MSTPFRMLSLHSHIVDGFGQRTEITVRLVVPRDWIDDATNRAMAMWEARQMRRTHLPPKACDAPAIAWIEEWSVSDDVPGGERTPLAWEG